MLKLWRTSGGWLVSLRFIYLATVDMIVPCYENSDVGNAILILSAYTTLISNVKDGFFLQF